MTVNRTLIRDPNAKIKVDAPFYTRTVEAVCMKDTLFDLSIGNLPGVGKPKDPNPEWLTRLPERKRRNVETPSQ